MLRGGREQERIALSAEANEYVKKADAFMQQHKYKSAYKQMKVALALKDKVIDDRSTLEGLRTLAWRAMEQGRTSTDLLYFRRAHSMFSTKDSFKDDYQNSVNGYNKAIEYIQQKTSIYYTSIQDCRWLATCYSGLGELSSFYELYARAESEYQHAIQELERIPLKKRTAFDEKAIKDAQNNMKEAAKAEYKSLHGCMAALKKYGFLGATPKQETEETNECIEKASYKR